MDTEICCVRDCIYCPCPGLRYCHLHRNDPAHRAANVSEENTTKAGRRTHGSQQSAGKEKEDSEWFDEVRSRPITREDIENVRSLNEQNRGRSSGSHKSSSEKQVEDEAFKIMQKWKNDRQREERLRRREMNRNRGNMPLAA